MRIPAASPPVAAIAERGPRRGIIPKGLRTGGDAEARLEALALGVERERLARELAAEAGKVTRGLGAQRARSREAHLEDAARMEDAGARALDRRDAALGVEVEARARAHAGRGVDAVAHEQDAVRVPGEAAGVARCAGERRVAVVPGVEHEAAGALAETHVAGAAAAPDAEGRPELALVLAPDLDGVVGARRAREVPALVGLVAVDPGIDDDAAPRQRELEGEQVGVSVPRQVLGTDRRGVADDVVARRLARTVVAGVGEREDARRGVEARRACDPRRPLEEHGGIRLRAERAVVQQRDPAV